MTLAGRIQASAKPVVKKKHRKAQALPLPRMACSQTWDPRSFQDVGAENKNRKEGMEVAKRYCNATSK